MYWIIWADVAEPPQPPPQRPPPHYPPHTHYPLPPHLGRGICYITWFMFYLMITHCNRPIINYVNHGRPFLWQRNYESTTKIIPQSIQSVSTSYIIRRLRDRCTVYSKVGFYITLQALLSGGHVGTASQTTLTWCTPAYLCVCNIVNYRNENNTK